MIEAGRIIGLGGAYVDAKILSSNLHLPSRRSELPAFLDAHPEANLYAGGSIPNILTAFIRLSGNPSIKLLSCVGNDPRGKFYAEHTDRRFGEPQVSTRNPTGILVGIYDEGSVAELDFSGAARDIFVSKEELYASRNEVFITDIDACRDRDALDPVKHTLDAIEDNGLFVLSLSGASSQESIDQLLSFTDRTPNVIFGNASELWDLSHEENIAKATESTFPTSRLVVITRGEEGAIIRFNGQVFSVPSIHIAKEKIIDETGAGDSYMGIMLALLSTTRYKDWSEYDVLNAARVASRASTLVIQSAQSRLTLEMAQVVHDYVKYSLENKLPLTW